MTSLDKTMRWHRLGAPDPPASRPKAQVPPLRQPLTGTPKSRTVRKTETYHRLTMPALTLNQAAKAAKKSKATLLKSIKNGRLTAPKDDLGRYKIDPAELFRVYPPNQSETGNENQSRPQGEPQETSVLQATVEHLRELLRQIESERDDLRQRLDHSEEERRATQTKLTALLTDQRAKLEPPRTGLWQRLFGRR